MVKKNPMSIIENQHIFASVSESYQEAISLIKLVIICLGLNPGRFLIPLERQVL